MRLFLPEVSACVSLGGVEGGGEGDKTLKKHRTFPSKIPLEVPPSPI